MKRILNNAVIVIIMFGAVVAGSAQSVISMDFWAAVYSVVTILVCSILMLMVQ